MTLSKTTSQFQMVLRDFLATEAHHQLKKFERYCVYTKQFHINLLFLNHTKKISLMYIFNVIFLIDILYSQQFQQKFDSYVL